MEKKKEVQNYLKVINFDHPEWIPAGFGFLPATWLRYNGELEKLILSHPTLFPHYKEGSYKEMKLGKAYKSGRWIDVWGVTWDNIHDGFDSAPVEELAPLKIWDSFEKYDITNETYIVEAVPKLKNSGRRGLYALEKSEPLKGSATTLLEHSSECQTFKIPDPLKYEWTGEEINWEERKKNIEDSKSKGGLPGGGLPHGAMYMKLYYLRGFQNFMMDIAARDPRLDKLIKVVLDYNMQIIEKWIEIGVEMIHFGDDLGHQKALPMSPADWRHYLKPCFAKMIGKCRENNVYTYLHTDGHILEIIPDLIECGLNVVNPQIRANTLEGIEKYCKGKIAINLDLDRQLFPFATATQIKDHVKRAIDTMFLPEGGLMLVAECGPDVPLKNIEAICEIFEDCGCRGG